MKSSKMWHLYCIKTLFMAEALFMDADGMFSCPPISAIDAN